MITGIIPSQAGWNKGDSQKLMTNFGTPRNTSTRVKAENLAVNHLINFDDIIYILLCWKISRTLPKLQDTKKTH